mgnify:CR=1 FL=1
MACAAGLVQHRALLRARAAVPVRPPCAAERGEGCAAVGAGVRRERLPRGHRAEPVGLHRLQPGARLSGGEQALTAMALIFAVFLINPAPICILDEVDAPLDDANVTRFCSLIEELTKITETKFIVITHHALTMSRMNRLYGVTMAERGVSQLVAVDLEKAEELVA